MSSGIRGGGDASDASDRSPSAVRLSPTSWEEAVRNLHLARAMHGPSLCRSTGGTVFRTLNPASFPGGVESRAPWRTRGTLTVPAGIGVHASALSPALTWAVVWAAALVPGRPLYHQALVAVSGWASLVRPLLHASLCMISDKRRLISS